MKKAAVFTGIILCASSLPAADFQRNQEIIKSILSEAENAIHAPVDKQKQTEPAADPARQEDGALTPAVPNQDTKPVTSVTKPAKKEKKKKAAGSAAKTSPGAEEEMLRTGIEMYGSGYLDDSLRIFAGLREKYPSSQYLDTARIWTGRVYMRKLEYRKAMDEFAAIAETSGEFPTALFETAGCLVTRGETVRAIETYTRVSSRFPADPKADDALLRLSELYARAGKGNEAVDASIRIIRDYPDRDLVDDAYYFLGHIYETDAVLRDFDLARRFYQLFIKKANQGEPVFTNSPLRSRVEQDLKVLETRQFRMTD